MLSSDKNVESLAQLIEEIKSYIGLQKEYLKFDVVEKLVRLITALTLAVIIFVIMIAVFFYFSFAAIYWMAPVTGLASAYAIVSAVFLIALILIIAFRKSWIERPLTKFLANVLLSN